MIEGRVIGSVWGARHVPGVTGRKLALVAELHEGAPTGRVIVAIDGLDARPEQSVLVTFGSGARGAVDPDAGRAVLADAAIALLIEP